MAKKSLRERLAEKKKELASKGGGNFKFFFIPEGSTRMRPLPVGEENEFAFEAIVFYLGKDMQNVISPATFGEKCAMMKFYQDLKESKDEKDKEFLKKFSPRKKYFSPHIRYKDDKGNEIDEEAGVKLLLLAGGQYNDLIDLWMDDEQGDFTDPIKGYDIKYKRTGKGKMDTEYSVVPCKPTKLPKKYRGPYDPEQMVRDLTPSYKETKELMEKFLDLPQEDEDEKPKKPKGKKSKKKKSDL